MTSPHSTDRKALIERLRKPCGTRPVYDENSPSKFRYVDNFDELRLEAADEIERLESALLAARRSGEG